MPALGPLIIAIIVIWLVAIYIVPTVSAIITAVLVGKAGKLSEDETVTFGFLFYFAAGFLFAVLTLMRYEIEGFLAFASFVLIVLFWPVPVAFMDFKETGTEFAIHLKVMIAAFVITQIAAVFKVLNRAREDTKKLD